jgi:hypothetical protein
MSDGELTFLDEVVALTRDPDESFEKLRERYASDDRLRVPATVLNSILDRPEAI